MKHADDSEPQRKDCCYPLRSEQNGRFKQPSCSGQFSGQFQRALVIGTAAHTITAYSRSLQSWVFENGHSNLKTTSFRSAILRSGRSEPLIRKGLLLSGVWPETCSFQD